MVAHRPAAGQFSLAELEHYRRVLATCHEQGIKPFVTFNHFTTPRWFAAEGGWENPRSPDLFARYCERTARHLADLIHQAATFNEPNLGLLLKWMLPPPGSRSDGRHAGELRHGPRARNASPASKWAISRKCCRSCWRHTERGSRQSSRRRRTFPAGSRWRSLTTRRSDLTANGTASVRR